MREGKIAWNDQVKLIVSDVDETIADNFTPATPEMTQELMALLKEGKVLFMVSGASLKRIRTRIIDLLPANLRKNILVAHCSGVEIWGFQENGELNPKPFYSLYEGVLTQEQKKRWREITQQLIDEFHLKTFEPMTAMEFKDAAGDDPLSIMIEDRGPQITFEVINAHDLTPEQEQALEVKVPLTHGNLDLRIPIIQRSEQLLGEANLPITPRLGGMWAIDFAVKGVNKTIAVKYVLENEEILRSVGLTKEDVANPKFVEIWGDKFSVLTGTDRHMSEALPKAVRAIDFREEDPGEFMPGYNTVLWNGNEHLHRGLLEYLQSRPR